MADCPNDPEEITISTGTPDLPGCGGCVDSFGLFDFAASSETAGAVDSIADLGQQFSDLANRILEFSGISLNDGAQALLDEFNNKLGELEVELPSIPSIAEIESCPAAKCFVGPNIVDPNVIQNTMADFARQTLASSARKKLEGIGNTTLGQLAGLQEALGNVSAGVGLGGDNLNSLSGLFGCLEAECPDNAQESLEKNPDFDALRNMETPRLFNDPEFDEAVKTAENQRECFKGQFKVTEDDLINGNIPSL